LARKEVKAQTGSTKQAVAQYRREIAKLKRQVREQEKGEIFFHGSSLEGTTFDPLTVGQQVEHEEGDSPKGPRAENVRLV